MFCLQLVIGWDFQKALHFLLNPERIPEACLEVKRTESRAVSSVHRVCFRLSCQAKIATLEVKAERRKSPFSGIILGMGWGPAWWGSPGAGTGGAQVVVKSRRPELKVAVPVSHSSSESLSHSSSHTSSHSTWSCPSSSSSPQSTALGLWHELLLGVPSVSPSSVGAWLKDLGPLLCKPLKKCTA